MVRGISALVPAAAPTPIPNLLRKLISGHRPRAYGDCAAFGSAGGGAARFGVLIDGFSGFNFHAAAQYSAIFNHQALCLQVASYVSGAPELNLFAADNFAVNTAAHDYFACKNVCFHFSIGPNRQASVAQVQLAFDVAVDERSSLPVTSPLMRMPWLMHAEDLVETGRLSQGFARRGSLTRLHCRISTAPREA